MRTLRIISYIVAPIAIVILFGYLACFGGEGCSGIPFFLALSVFYVVSLVAAVIILFTQKRPYTTEQVFFITNGIMGFLLLISALMPYLIMVLFGK